MSELDFGLRRLFFGGLLVAVGGVAPLASQPDDVELLGREYGTPPPPGYLEARATGLIPPEGMTFRRGWMARNPALRIAGRDAEGVPRFEAVSPAAASPATVLGERNGAVAGTFRVPLVLGHFADDPATPPWDHAAIQREFFDGPSSRYRTLSEYYDVMSEGRVDLRGATFPWIRSSLTQREAAGPPHNNGLSQGSRIAAFIRSLLEELDDGTIDWGLFDNDGPDGIPNSGDDDGYVDVLAVIHPTWGAECGGTGREDRIWSHKFTLSQAAAFDADAPPGPYVTSTPSASGGFIRIDDYTIQPLLSCLDKSALNEIGVLAHELGHAFGLPDLYCTTPGCAHSGIGRWGLMGQGSWGCHDQSDPSRPCGMSAWSRAMLGWVEVESLAPDTDHPDIVLDPVATSGRVLRLDARDGSGDYFLLENRQRIGFDRDLFAPGLLVWKVDPLRLLVSWPINRVNTDPNRLGVAVVEADGMGNLTARGSGANLGDPGDPFPGATGNTVFHAGRAPQAYSHRNQAAGVTLTAIREVGEQIHLRATSGFRVVTVGVEGATTPGLVTVDDVALPAGGKSFTLAPFEALVVSAAPGESLGEGWRRPFVGWSDRPSAPALRVVVAPLAHDSTVIARYGGEEVALTVALEGGVLGVDPGAVTPTPPAAEGWIPVGTEVILRAVPTAGYTFDAWLGEWAGRPNPFSLTATAPLSVGARFHLSFEALARALVGGSAPLDPRLANALDEAGNRDGRFDVGDLRAHLLSREGQR